MSLLIRSIFLNAVIAFLLLVQNHEVSAQLSMGMYGGIAANKLNGDPVAFNLYKPHVGWNAGLILDLNITHDILLSLQPGIMYSYGRVQTADTVEFPFNIRLIYRDSADISFGTANLPVLIKVITDNRRFEFSSGLEIEYLIRSRWDNGKEKLDISSYLKDFNVSIIFGMGYRIPINETNLTIEILYAQGIVNQSRSDTDILASNRIKTSCWRFQVAWTLPFKKTDRKDD